MKLIDEIIEGIFLKEKKNRFLCEVLINDKIEECYIPSASKLNNYINLKNKKVILTKNIGTNRRTRYSVFAVEYYNKFIILNMSIVNRVLEEYININYKYKTLYREKYIDNYKADFLIENDNKIIIEAKGIIATRKSVLFPTVYSERAIEQLKKIYELISEGWNAEYYFISLSPIVREVTINRNSIHVEYWELLKKCADNGMLIKAFNLSLVDREVKVINKINIIL